MIRVVLDANVFISGLISEKGPPGQIIDSWISGKFEVWITRDIFVEIQKVLGYPHIKDRIVQRQSDFLLTNLQFLCFWVTDDPNINPLTVDPSDNKYLACATKANANYLITGNLSHFKEVEFIFRGIPIISPRRLLDILTKNKTL